MAYCPATSLQRLACPAGMLLRQQLQQQLPTLVAWVPRHPEHLESHQVTLRRCIAFHQTSQWDAICRESPNVYFSSICLALSMGHLPTHTYLSECSGHCRQALAFPDPVAYLILPRNPALPILTMQEFHAAAMINTLICKILHHELMLHLIAGLGDAIALMCGVAHNCHKRLRTLSSANWNNICGGMGQSTFLLFDNFSHLHAALRGQCYKFILMFGVCMQVQGPQPHQHLGQMLPPMQLLKQQLRRAIS